MTEEQQQSTPRKTLRDVIIGIVAGIVIEPTLKALDLDKLVPYVPQIWVAILIFLTLDALFRNKRFRQWAPPFYKSLTTRKKIMSYLVVAFIGAATFSLYWMLVTTVFKAKSAHTTTESPTETKEAKEKQVAKPDLRLEIDEVSSGTDAKDGNQVLIIIAAISNVGIPSIADKWEAFLTLPDNKVLHGRPLFIGSGISGTTHDGRPFKAAAIPLYEKSMTPITNGAKIVGSLLFDFPGATEGQINQKGNTLELACHDVTGRRISASMPLREEPTVPRYYPGAQNPSPSLRQATKTVPTPTIQLPSIGNIKQRAMALSGEIMDDLYNHGWPGMAAKNPYYSNLPVIRRMPLQEPAIGQWMNTRSQYFKFRLLPKIIDIRNEFAELHLRDERLDGFLKYQKMAEDSNKSIAAAGYAIQQNPILPQEIEEVAERLKVLSGQIKDDK
ncbi:MAG TPA: hypothetical protein VGK01_12220 [Candidatus Angelobacter sp.]|jgi:hypothetical protein